MATDSPCSSLKPCCRPPLTTGVLRLCFAKADEVLDEAIDRLGRAGQAMRL